MENRIDDSSSTAARHAREPDLKSIPCVETVMTAFGYSKKKAGHHPDGPAC
jgi:hypothetical protein